MREVLSIAETTDASSVAASKSSEEVGLTAETLRSEVTEFLAAMSRGDEAERQLYERIPAGGLQVIPNIAGRPGVQATVGDISRGGMSLMHSCDDKVGTDAMIALPQGGSINGRIANNIQGLLGFTFRQDEASLAQIDRMLALARENNSRKAA
jgi:hypothetical protein